ncbi:hypothetical protein BH10ACT1_BH10ACT1_37000 [soil metagenome]
MASVVMDPSARDAIDLLTAGLDALSVAGVDPFDCADAVNLVRELEVVERRLRCSQVELVGRIDQRGLHRFDGHRSAKVFLRHHARLSDAEASRRTRSAKVLASCPAVREGFASGRIGVDHLARIGRAHANPRITEKLIRQDTNVATLAERLSYEKFDARLSDWESRADEDGTWDRNQRHHDNRDFDFQQEFDKSWAISGGGSALDGAQAHAVFSTFLAAELALDWEKARAEHGEHATVEHLPRSQKHRNWDAFAHAMDLAAAGFTATEGGPAITTDLVIDHATFTRETSRLAGVPVPAAEPILDTSNRPYGTTGYRCSNLDGHVLEATEAVAAALLGRIRRVVIGADSVVIDLGRRSRCFTGPAQLAAMLTGAWCYWPGCIVPASQCQIDHLIPWANGGRTDPGNGAPACGRHNRFKEAGYSARRDEHGNVHTYRPDGTEIT